MIGGRRGSGTGSTHALLQRRGSTGGDSTDTEKGGPPPYSLEPLEEEPVFEEPVFVMPSAKNETLI